MAELLEFEEEERRHWPPIWRSYHNAGRSRRVAVSKECEHILPRLTQSLDFRWVMEVSALVEQQALGDYRETLASILMGTRHVMAPPEKGVAWFDSVRSPFTKARGGREPALHFASKLKHQSAVEAIYWSENDQLVCVWAVIDGFDRDTEDLVFDAQEQTLQIFHAQRLDFNLIYRRGRSLDVVRPANTEQLK